jgi:hypothetical protein
MSYSSFTDFFFDGPSHILYAALKFPVMMTPEASRVPKVSKGK